MPRWVKSAMNQSGVDTYMFIPLNACSTFVSKAAAVCVSVVEIHQSAGW